MRMLALPLDDQKNDVTPVACKRCRSLLSFSSRLRFSSVSPSLGGTSSCFLAIVFTSTPHSCKRARDDGSVSVGVSASVSVSVSASRSISVSATRSVSVGVSLSVSVGASGRGRSWRGGAGGGEGAGAREKSEG